MAHFAQLDDNDIVVNVVVVDNSVLAEPDGSENESKGIAYLREICGEQFDYVQTSIHANFRGQFAGIGGKYDRKLDEFCSVAPALNSDGSLDHFEWN